MWGKATWGTSAARWGAVAAVSGVVAAATPPAGAQAGDLFGGRIAAAGTIGPASVTASSLFASGSFGFVVESANIVAAAAAPVGIAAGRGAQIEAIQAASLSADRAAVSTVRLDATSSAMALTAWAVTSAPQLSAATASSATAPLSLTSVSSADLARGFMVATGQAVGLGAQTASARAAEGANSVSAAVGLTTGFASGAATTAAQFGLLAAQLEPAEADVVVGDFIGPQGLIVENAKADTLAIGRATGRSVDSTLVVASTTMTGLGATNAARTESARGASGTIEQAAAVATQLAAITAVGAFTERGGLPVFSIEGMTAAEVSASLVAALGTSTSLVNSGDLFGSTPNQFANLTAAVDALALYAPAVVMNTLTMAAAQAGQTSAGTAQAAASYLLNIVFVADAWPAGAESFASLAAAAQAAEFAGEGAGQFGTSASLAWATASYDPLRSVLAVSFETAFVTALMSSTSLKAPAFFGTVKRKVSPILIGRTS